MRCPSCNQPDYRPAAPCPGCQFSGDKALVEELAHIQWLLGQIKNWLPADVSSSTRSNLQQRYSARQWELEVALGLRPPPFSRKEARQAWPRFFQQRILHRKLGEWEAEGLIESEAARQNSAQLEEGLKALSQRLEGHSRPHYPATERGRLDVITYLTRFVQDLPDSSFATQTGREQMLAPLQAEKERLEIKLKLRTAPATKPVVKATVIAEPTIEKPAAALPTPTAAVPAVAVPAVPFRERLWRTILSERTLHAILFLGIFLLFSAAISFVIWGWRNFSSPVRVAIPAGFTALFFALGWYIRNKTTLYRSGIALSAIAALLIPIDFYTVFSSFNIPIDYFPPFWLGSSLLCIVAYLIAALIIQSRLFGYLVGMATGSAVLAAIEISHHSLELSRDWYSAGLSALALLLLLLASWISRRPQPGRWQLFARSFPVLSLLTVGALMPLTFGWRFIDRETYDTLHYALTVNWWLGGLILGWGAVVYRSRALGILAAVALPVAVYLAQAALFHQAGINLAWHAIGLACLVPLYLSAGHKLLARQDDPILYGHGRTATRWGVALLIVAALWPFTDLSSGAATAASHAVLTAALILAATLWQRPPYLYAASTLSLSAVTFTLAELGLTPVQMSVGWASLSIAYIIIALSVGQRARPSAPNFAEPLVASGYAIALLAPLLPVSSSDGDLSIYTLGNWIGLAVWGARLAHRKQPGFGEGKDLFHWFAAIPLPVWLWILIDNTPLPGFYRPLALAILAWGMVMLSYRLGRANSGYRPPWRWTGLLVNTAAPIAAAIVAPNEFTLSLCLLSAGILFFVDTIISQQSVEFVPAGLLAALGTVLLLDRLQFSPAASSFCLALLVTLYFLTGLWAERWKSPRFTARFLAPHYHTTHLLTLAVLAQIYLRPWQRLFYNAPWTDEMRLWGAASQLLLGVVYGLYAWGRYRERWGHAAAWLGAAGGGFIAIAFSRGRGSSAAKAALMAIIFVLAERGLHWLRHHPGLRRRPRAFARLAWRLYRRPLLVAGWTVSAGAILLALVRNLALLGGGRIQQTWAAVGLLLVTGLYALSARLFRQARFAWLASWLLFAPWTILTNLGWFLFRQPTLPGFAFSWTLLAWSLFLLHQWARQRTLRAYVRPLQVVSHILLPFSLLWGVAHVETSRFTYGLAVALYAVAAWLDLRQASRPEPWASKFLYPAFGLVPVWSIYLLAWLCPGARHEHFGLMLLFFGPLGLAAGRWLKHLSVPPLAAYLTGYISAIVGTMLLAHIPTLLVLGLLFDVLLLLVSARLFREPLWVYPAAVIVPASLLIALRQANIAGERQGWWLIGLAALYFGLTALLRRVKLSAYGTGTLTAGFALIALGLPPSSQDQIGAFWGYGGAALLYAITAFWLRQPLLLTPFSALSIVPYAIGIQRSALQVEYTGLALFPGALVALVLAWALDVRFGHWRDFPWNNPTRWPAATADRLLNWWALPFYTLGFGMAIASPIFTGSRSDLTALNLVLLVPLFGWAIARFRLRGWLLATVLAGHLAAAFYLDSLGWWRLPASAWLRFLPVTVITTLIALIIERRRDEGSPLTLKRATAGWSRPLYALALLDSVVAQFFCLQGLSPAATVTLVHALLIALLASIWRSHTIAYIGAALSATALYQWLTILETPTTGVATAFARLSLAYGLAGYGLSLLRGRWRDGHELPGWLATWEFPLRNWAIALSIATLLATGQLALKLVSPFLRALLGFRFRHLVHLPTVQMVIGVLSLLGLLYIAAAVVHRRLRLGYLAVGMLLGSWILFALFIQGWDDLARMQWYAIPAGLYLLAMAYLEWRRDKHLLARRLDYAAMLLMLGSLFWQTLLFGWRFALLMGAEGLFIFWWGSARRLRRFFYAGMVAVILATAGQLINSLQSVNQWIAFGIIGLSLIIVGAVVERKFEEIKTSLEKMLETWE